MARTKNLQATEKKRQEILGAFQRLIYSKGYESVSIQDVLDATKMSKGAFYHYFDSKQSMLTTLIEWMLGQGEVVVARIARQENVGALEKLNQIFIESGKWKMQHGKEVFAVFAAWYEPGNDLIRYRMRNAGTELYRPYYERIIQEGIDQGDFVVSDASTTATILFTVVTDLSDTVSRLILNQTMTAHEKELRLDRAIKEYASSLERMLGASEGSIALIDGQALRYWTEIAKGLARDVKSTAA